MEIIIIAFRGKISYDHDGYCYITESKKTLSGKLLMFRWLRHGSKVISVSFCFEE